MRVQFPLWDPLFLERNCIILCKSARDIGKKGETAVRDKISDMRLYYSEQGHLLITMTVDTENEPFDMGLSIDYERPWRVQVKATEYVSSDGSMVFDTCKKDGQAYNPGEIDFFVLYCLENKWFGIALPSECKTSTEIWLHRNPSEVLRVAQDFNFERRLHELITEKEITPLILKEKSTSTPYANWPKTVDELIDILSDHGMNEFEANEHTGIPISSFIVARKNGANKKTKYLRK